MTYSAFEREARSRDGSGEFVLVAETVYLDVDIVCHDVDWLTDPYVAGCV